MTNIVMKRLSLFAACWICVCCPGYSAAQGGGAPPGGEAAGAGAPEPEAGSRFDVMEYVVEGNSVLSALAIEEAVYPFLGPGRGIRDVDAARLALEQAYHKGGYLTVFVDVPEQEVKQGTVRLRVTEGRVERQRVSGATYYALGRIKRLTPELAEGNVPYFPQVQKELAQANRSADRRVTPALRAGRDRKSVV